MSTAPPIASSDRVQQFNNGSNITGTIANGVTVDGFGLQLRLTNGGGNNTIDFTNGGTVTTNQNVNALELNGNGGLVTYTGTGTVSTTAGARQCAGHYKHRRRRRHGHQRRPHQLVQQPRPFHPDGDQHRHHHRQWIRLHQRPVGGISATADGAADINITSGGSITGVAAGGIVAYSSGGNVLIATGSTVSGGSVGIHGGPPTATAP